MKKLNQEPQTTPINLEQYIDSVKGCFLGKNIGGTLGAPFEGKQDIFDVSFYTQNNLNGNPEPNDDLDLQLIWLTLIEYYGLYNITPRLLGEHWVNTIIGPWNEYAVCRENCQAGFYPPLSGAMNNDIWKWSNGAWIRSEIWACLFPGNPDAAIDFAYLDACCDHVGEGIYAEMFTAALESAAFVEKDVSKLIDIGLSKIPEDSRINRSIQIVRNCYSQNIDWKTARNQVVEDSADLGWFQSPANIAFTVLGLLYGQGDFSKSICLATNCGDDTDCTAATVGSILGIIYGAKNIPEKWLEPIGDNILTKSLNRFNLLLPLPKTVTELTNRIVRLYQMIENDFPRPKVENLYSQDMAKELWNRSPYKLDFNISFATIGVEYLNSPIIVGGVSCPIRLWVHSPISSMTVFKFRWILPEEWKSALSEVTIAGSCWRTCNVDTEITPPDYIDKAFNYITLEVTTEDRNYPILLTIPFQRKDGYKHPNLSNKNVDWPAARRVRMINLSIRNNSK